MDRQLEQKEALLAEILRGYGRVAVAFSGGVDSTLLLDVAHDVLGGDAVALTVCMAGLPERERRAAHGFCEERNICQLELAFDEFAIVDFANNPPNRCYLCKRALLGVLLAAAHAEGISTLIEGSNLDDEKDYRPGSAALAEYGVASPLKTAGLTKDDIRVLSRKRGLSTWNKPACACLATRLPVGARLSPELLTRIDNAEQCILDSGAHQVRVRVHDDMARIEVDEASMPLFGDEALRTHINTELHRLGFKHVTLDLGGYRMGSLNTSVPS